MSGSEFAALSGLRQHIGLPESSAGRRISANASSLAAESARMFDFAEITGIAGDYLAPFDPSSTPFSATEKPIGAAASSGQDGKIDRKSKLYAQALELESYFVKIMVSAMRNTVPKTSAGGGEESFAAKIYGDMLYDQLSRTVTQNAGFGLADQIYLQLS